MAVLPYPVRHGQRCIRAAPRLRVGQRCPDQCGPGRAGPAHHGREARRPGEAQVRGSARGRRPAGRAPARQGQDDGARADRRAAGPRLVHRVRRAGQAPGYDFGMARSRPVRRRRGHRVRHDRRPAGGRVQPGLHRQRRVARRGLRREDRQGHGLRAEDRLPDDRHQRQRRRPDPGRRSRARPVRRDLLPERHLLRRDPADLADHGPVRGRRGVLAGDHRLHADGGQDLVHVHHRARRDQDGDRRGGQPGGARRRARAQRQVRRRPLSGRRRAGLPGVRPGAAVLPAVQQPGRAAGTARSRRIRRPRSSSPTPTPSWTR